MNLVARFALIASVLLFPCAAVTAAAAEQPAARKPNIIFIVADDLGYADVGFQGLSKDVKTPNIDSIAASGVRFTNGYVSCPVCSPTRAGLMTGRYQQRFGFEQNPLGREQEDEFGLPLDEVTLPQQLKKAGYATGAVGKWHLGHNQGMHPLDRGFDEFFGFLGGAHRYVKNAEPAVKDNNAIRRGREPVGEKEYLTDAFSREAVSFVERHKDDPFFLYLPYNAPHSPMQAPPKYQKRFADEKDETRRTFLAMMAAVDDGVGRILETLRANKLEESTLVVFMSDNGGPTWGNTSRNAPLAGGKGATFEGGVRVPFAMQWKGKLPAGRVDDRAVVQLDLFSTALSAAGAAPPEGRTIDGKDLLPYLAEGNKETIHDALFWRFGARRGMRAGGWKLQWNGAAAPALYDLAKDAGEATDVAAANGPVVERLMARYREWESQLAEPRWRGRTEGNGTRDVTQAVNPAAERE